MQKMQKMSPKEKDMAKMKAGDMMMAKKKKMMNQKEMGKMMDKMKPSYHS